MTDCTRSFNHELSESLLYEYFMCLHFCLLLFTGQMQYRQVDTRSGYSEKWVLLPAHITTTEHVWSSLKKRHCFQIRINSQLICISCNCEFISKSQNGKFLELQEFRVYIWVVESACTSVLKFKKCEYSAKSAVSVGSTN